MSKEKRNGLLVWVFLITLAFIWGSSFILIKRGIEHLNFVQVASLRIFAASVFLLPFSFHALKNIDRKLWGWIFLSGLAGNLLPAFLFSLAQTNLSSSTSGIFNSLAPIFVIVFGLIFFHQKFRFNQLTGVLFGLAGASVLIFGNDNSLTLKINSYALLLVLATAFYGLSANILKHKLSFYNSLHISALTLFFIGPLAMSIFFISGGATASFETKETFHSFLYIVLLGFMGTALAQIIFNLLLKKASAVFASSVTYLIPIVAILWGVLDGEQISIFHIVGMGFVFLGLYLLRGKS